MYFVLLWLELFRLPATAIMLLQCARLNQSLFWNIKSSEKARHYISHADFKNKHPVGKVNGISGFTLPDSDVQKVMSATLMTDFCQRRFREVKSPQAVCQSQRIGFASCSV